MKNGVCLTTHRNIAIDRAKHIALGTLFGIIYTLLALSVFGYLK